MTLPKSVRRQRDFSAGQIDDIAERRSDTKIFDAALKLARNIAPADAGAAKRRPGRRVVYFEDAAARHFMVRPAGGRTFDIGLSHNGVSGTFTVRAPGGGIVSTVSGARWTADQVNDLWWAADGNTVWIGHRSFVPQVFTFDGVATWTLADFSFRRGVDNNYKAPFYRYDEAIGATMWPSARTGSIQLATSADVFNAAHVNCLFKWAGRQVLITGVTNARRATATVIEGLSATWRVTVTAGQTAGFRVGEIVASDTSDVSGEVVAINAGSNYLDILMSGDQTSDSGFVSGDIIVGERGRATWASQAAVTTPPATTQWEEQFMSDYRGWPGSGAVAFQRLMLADFEQLEKAVIASAVGAPDDLEVTAEADGAFFETLPVNARAMHILGGSDLFVLTDRGPFYVPVSEATPLEAGAVRFRQISTDGCSETRPAPFATGVVYIAADDRRVLALVGTGQTAQPYAVQALTDFHRDLFTGPIGVTYSDGTTAVPGRRIYVVNADGTAVVGRYGDGEEFVGWFPWTGDGDVQSVAALGGDLVFNVAYDGIYTGEELDPDAMLDGTINLSAGSDDPIQLSTGASLTDSTGEPIYAHRGVLTEYAGLTLHAWVDGEYAGEVEVDPDGTVDLEGEDIDVGWLFTPQMEPFVPTFDGGESFGQALKRRKISRVAITVKDTQTFIADGRPFAGYLAGDDMAEPRPLRSTTYAYRQLGRSYDPVVEISQPTPGRLTITEVAIEVTA